MCYKWHQYMLFVGNCYVHCHGIKATYPENGGSRFLRNGGTRLAKLHGVTLQTITVRTWNLTDAGKQTSRHSLLPAARKKMNSHAPACRVRRHDGKPRESTRNGICYVSVAVGRINVICRLTFGRLTANHKVKLFPFSVQLSTISETSLALKKNIYIYIRQHYLFYQYIRLHFSTHQSVIFRTT